MPRAIAPDERVHVQQALVLIEERTKPATRDEIIAIITRAMVHDHNTKRSEVETAAILADYADDLSVYSADHLQAAFREHRQENNWFPKIAELRKLLIRRKAAAEAYRSRAQLLLGLREPSAWEADLVIRLKDERERSASRAGELDKRLQGVRPDVANAARGLASAAAKNMEQPRSSAA